MKKRKTKLGRKTLLNPALCQKICDLLADANTIATVCDACGIDERTFHNWVERGEKEARGEFFHFFQSATRARATAKIKLVKIVTTLAVKDWRAAAFLLERSWPEDYGRRAPEEVESTKKTQQFPPNIKINIHTDDESELAVLIMEESRKPGGGDREKIRRWQQTIQELAELPEDEIIGLDDPRNPHYQAPPKGGNGRT